MLLDRFNDLINISLYLFLIGVLFDADRMIIVVVLADNYQVWRQFGMNATWAR